MNISVTNYELTSDKVIAELYDGNTETTYTVSRDKYENWLTDGTGIVKCPITYTSGAGEMQEVDIECTLSEYWEQGKEINSSPILLHLLAYIKQELSEDNLKALFYQEQILSLIPEKDRIIAKMYLGQFGMHKVLHGIHELKRNLDNIQRNIKPEHTDYQQDKAA